MIVSEARASLAWDLLTYLSDNLDQAAYVKARLSDDEGELLGEHFNAVNLAKDLLWGTRCIDLHSEEAGGSVPVDLDAVDRIEVDIG